MHSAHTTKNNIYSNTQHIHIIIICKLSCPATTSLPQSWCFRKLKACSCEPRVASTGLVEDFCSQNTGALPLTCVIWRRCGGRIWDMRSRKPQKSHRFLSKNKLKWSIVKNPENHWPTAIIQEILREKLCGHGMPWMKTMDFHVLHPPFSCPDFHWFPSVTWLVTPFQGQLFTRPVAYLNMTDLPSGKQTGCHWKLP